MGVMPARSRQLESYYKEHAAPPQSEHNLGSLLCVKAMPLEPRDHRNMGRTAASQEAKESKKRGLR